MTVKRSIPTFALQQVTSKYARNNAAKTLEKPVGLNYVARYLDVRDADELRAKFPEGKLYVWGSKFERVHQYDRMVPGHCLVLFRRDAIVYKSGVVVKWLYRPALAEHLWGVDADDETWSLVFFLSNIKDRRIPAHEINNVIGRNPDDHWQGMVVISPPMSDAIVAFLQAQRAQDG